MKTRKYHSLHSCLALIAALLVAGCSSTPDSPALKQGAKTSKSIQHAADATHAANAQISVTTAALHNLVDRPQDIPKQYKTLAAQIDKLRSNFATVSDASDKMRVKGDQYIADWSRGVAKTQDSELRDAAFARHAEVAKDLQDIVSNFQSVKALYQPFLNSLNDVQTVLGADLSVGGLNAVKSYVSKVDGEAEKLKTALDKLATDFHEAGLKLQPSVGSRATK